MKTIRSIAAGSSHRLPARLKLVSTRLGSLLLLFQRMPVVQFLFPEANIIGGATVANSVSLAVTTVVGLGAYDSVAGATATITQVSPINSASEKKVPAAVGSSLTFSFKCTAPSIAEEWACTPNPPAPGLVHNNVPFNNTNSITGTPTTAGQYPVNIEVWGDPAEPSQYKLQAFTIYVLGFTTQPAASQTIPSGNPASLTCTVTGVPTGVTPTYQWYEKVSGTDILITGANSSSFAPSPPATTSYWVKVTSTLSGYAVSVNSNTAVVNVTTPTSVSVAVSPSSALENSGSAMVYTFTRTGSTTSSLTANYTVGGSATAGTDYPSTTGTVTFAASSPTATVSITPTGDTTVEPDETVTLTVGAGSGYTVGAPAAATGTITNDDTAYSSWASGLSVGQNGPTQMPMGDGVTNLEKFAFNMDPSKPDVRHLTVGGIETNGLPAGARVGGVLRIEFLRRKSSSNPGITYTPQFSSNIGVWDNFDGAPVSVSDVGPPGTIWERVVVDDPNLTGGTARFGRVKLVKAP